MDSLDIKSLISIVISILSLAGVGTLTAQFWQDRREKKKAQTEESKRKIDEERKIIIRSVVKEQLGELKDNLDKIEVAVDGLKESDIISRKGIQAILRDRLYSLYHQCMTQGWYSRDDFENFENMYEQYHSLGKNGIMDTRREKFHQLLTQEEYERTLGGEQDGQ